MKCGRTESDGAILSIDHIKARSRYPELALSFKNMQVLCLYPCNVEKGVRTMDFRPISKVWTALSFIINAALVFSIYMMSVRW